MAKIFIFESFGGVALGYSAQGVDSHQAAKQAVLKDVPFWVVSKESLPFEYPVESWEIDFDSIGEPSGYGERND